MAKNRNSNRAAKSVSQANANSSEPKNQNINGFNSSTVKPPPVAMRNGKSSQKLKKKISGNSFVTKTYLVVAVIGVVAAVASYFIYSYIQEQKTLSPFAGPLIPYDRSYANSLLWGTYRPGAYFGLRSRTPNSLDIGMMWFSYSASQFSLNHLCDQKDGLYYGWQEHDGRNYGYQEIYDEEWNITTTFIKRTTDQASDWQSVVTVNLLNETPAKSASATPKISRVGLFIYFRLEDKGELTPVMTDGHFGGIEGSTPSLGYFKISLKPEGNHAPGSFLAANSPSITNLKDTVFGGIVMDSEKGLRLVGQISNSPNLIVYEVAAEAQFTLNMFYEPLKADLSSAGLGSLEEPGLIGELIAKKKRDFREKFASVFKIKDQGWGDSEVEFARRTLSNLVGGIGYFHGRSLIASKWSSNPAKYWKTGLFTAVPSRSFFPRGFLWDEGFHQLVISRWDVGLTREIMSSWFNLMNARGWIPREQILGEEARSRVPAEFLVQNSDYANPPSFFLAIESMLDHLDPDRPDEVDKTLKFFEFTLPRMQAWYNWFNTTQLGSVPGSYRWRGRNETTDREVNPKTLTSGLDDYPRASHPGTEERHVDLYCWMAYAAGVLARVTEEIGENPTHYREAEQYLKNNARLDELHWSEELKTYADYGKHTNNVRLVSRPTQPNARPGTPIPPKVRIVDREPTTGYVDAFGYVSLFPLMLRLIDPSSAKLGIILEKLRDPGLLWTEFGIRSLAKNSPLFMKHNTEHDPPYWRGPIWINMNYLIWKALKHYADVPGPFQTKSANLAAELRRNVVANMYKQYLQTGFVWEQYVDQSGEGKGSHPFTGWSSLVVLFMSDF